MAADQKKLRELMRKEKERRSGGSASTAGKKCSATPVPQRRPDMSRPMAEAEAARTRPRRSETPATPATPPPEVMPAQKEAAAKDVSGRQADALAMPPPAARSQRSQGATLSDALTSAAGVAPAAPVAAEPARVAADARAMPPPALPVRVTGAPPPPLPGTAADNASGDQDTIVAHPTPLEAVEGPSLPPAGLDASQETDEHPGGDEPPPPRLPSGFFDDPELDAKARGVEAPSVAAARELEEGLKRFEREIAVEQEQAEETRNEIDEERFVETTMEEEEFQKDLYGRIEALRKRRKTVHLDGDSVQQKELDTEGLAAEEEDVDEGSDVDVDFDWRAKGFG
mmetsp:Transcript_35334/g.77246  ORF Transcript_35334/g.77246 Transcript_35334/m.77246 type:complete len:341 (-) Transcript_35334:98-1120(-)